MRTEKRGFMEDQTTKKVLEASALTSELQAVAAVRAQKGGSPNV